MDRKPDGALGKITRQIAAPKLSPFKTNDYIVVVNAVSIHLQSTNLHDFLCIDEIALLFSYLTSNGYTHFTNKNMQTHKFQE